MSSTDVWVERYRPNELGKIVGQPLIINKIRQNISAGNITNMIFSGPNGTGKTTTALVVGKAFFGNQLIGNFKEVNASEKSNRGIEFVSKEIIPFMREGALNFYAPFKILLLEEADNLTADAQAALRRPFEKYNQNCRVIMTVNYLEKIIPAIQSRFTVYEFQPINKDALIRRLHDISLNENLALHEKQYDSIADKVKGDLRKGIGILQNLQVDASDMNGVF